MSDCSRPHGLQPTRLLCPWDFPGTSTGVGCHRNDPQMKGSCMTSPYSVCTNITCVQLSVKNSVAVFVPSPSHVRLSETPRTAARQGSLSITISRSLLKLMSFESAMPSNHLLFRPLLFPPSLFPKIGAFSMGCCKKRRNRLLRTLEHNHLVIRKITALQKFIVYLLLF